MTRVDGRQGSIGACMVAWLASIQCLQHASIVRPRRHAEDPCRNQDLLSWDQACWRKEANLHIDQPEFYEQEPFVQRLIEL